MAEGQGVAGCSGETAESSSVLLVSGQYATSEDCSSPVSRQVAQTLTGAGRKVYSTVLEDTEEDRKCAKADGVELILPTRSQGDTREPCLAWLTFDHVDRYPNDRLPPDVGWIVGHAGVTSRAAATIKEQRFPQASLSLVTQTIPEDTEKYKEDEKAMGIGEKEDSIRKDAEKADTVFSVGHRTHDHFTISFCAIPEDKKPAHYLFLPKPSDLFLNTTVKHLKTSQKVVLLIGRVTTDERVKGFDLAAKVLSKVVERSQDRIKLRICGVSKEEYQASMGILQTSINSGKLIPTLLPHCTQEDVCRHMQQAHLVLMPSRAEPFGLVGLEAMAAGVPVLISDQSGLADLVHKVVPEFRHSVLRITGDDSVDVGRWADQIADVLRMSEAEFRRAAELKQKLLESKYWEESHQQLLQAFGCAGHVAEVQKGKSCATLTGETATDGGSRNPSEPGSPRASSSQLKRKGEDGEEFPGKKKLARCTEEGSLKPSSSQQKRKRKRKKQLPVKKKATPRQSVDVEKYFDKVINGVSYKWDDLARKLGFNENEIKGIRTDETLKPDQDHRCREVLNRWRNREGRGATLQVLKQALINIGERATAESLEAVAHPGPITIAEVTENSIRVTWTEAAGNKDSYRISITPTDGVIAPTASVNPGDPLEHTLTSLTAGTEYTVSVVTVSCGVSSVARTKTQRTTVAQPGPITIAEVTENSIRITWTEAAGTKDSYRISITPTDGVTAPTASVNPGDPLEHTLTSLTAGTEYTVSVVTVSCGVSSVARTKTQRTTVAQPGPITIAEVTENSIRVTWTEAAGNKDSYRISITPTDGVIAPTASVNPGDPLEHTLTSLTAGTEYTVSVVTVSCGVSSVARTKTQRTTVAQPGPITIAEVTENSIRITWTEAAGTKDSYRISITPTDGVTAPSASVNPGDPLKHTFTGLTAGTEYTVSVVTVSGGECSVARTKTQRTTVAQPGPITIAEVTENSIRVTWTEAAGPKDSYRISISPTDGVTAPTASVNPGDPLEHTFTGLTAGTEYTVSVVTVSCGVSSVARTKTQRTTVAQPGPITIAEVTENSIRVTWTEAAGPKDSYRISISPVTGVTNSTGSVNPRNPLEHIFSTLTAATLYTISVVTVCGGVNSVARTETQRTSSPKPSSSQRKRKRKRRFTVKKKAKATPSRQSESDLFQKSVKRRYELKLTHFKPLIWNDNFTLSLSDIFTQLELIPTSERNFKTSEKQKWSESMKEEQRKELKSLDDLFKPDVTGLSTAPRCILIEGEAGGGKTTFLSKEALDAVSQKTELGRRHNIVLLIRLREVREGETIEEMVWDQCVPETTEGIEAQSIRTILQRNKSHVVFLLDGYDELRPEARAAGQAIPKLLSGKMYPNSTIVITSRPSAGVQQYTRPDGHVHIMGFSRRHVEKYMQQYFTVVGKQELTKTLTLHVKGNQLLNTLIYTPMFLMFVCLLWEEDQEMVSTGTMMGLYDNLLTCLVRKCCKRQGVDMPTEGLPTEVAESLLQLGKLALEALLRNETLLDVTEVKREKVNWELLLKLGVVSLEVSSSKLHPRKQLNFSHKTMQEFLAGRYVAHAQVKQDIVELLQLTSISKALELSNLLQFTCGCGSQAAQAVMEELSKLSSREFTHLKPEQFESSNVPKDPDVQKSCQTYRRFAHLCLNILSERQEPEVLQGISQALPSVILDNSINSREATALKYYIQNLHSANLPDRLILKIHGGTDSRDIVQYLQQCFTTSLPGLKLDLKLSGQFDSPDLTARLVSVLKNVPCLRVLDLSLTKLTPSSLQPLVQGFRHMSLLEELYLSGNSALGDAGMEVLQVGLSSVPHLAVLRFRLVNMTAVGMSSLAPYMRHLVGLRELDISYNKIGDTGLESLTTVLHTFTAMQVLGLCATGISPTGMRTLVPVLCKLTRLIKLDISINDIGDPGLECLAAILHHLTAMKVLVLSVTDISDKGISSLIKALPHLVQLQVLDVRWNNIGDSGIVSLVQTLCQPSSLDMEQNPHGDKSLTTLQELHIGGNEGVTGAGLGRVAQVISTLPALTRLDMSGHQDTPAHLSDTAAMDLAEALPRLPALEQLDLWNISMEPAGFQAVVQAAEEHPTLEKLVCLSRQVPSSLDPLFKYTSRCKVWGTTGVLTGVFVPGVAVLTGALQSGPPV
ncbi:PREDICTED: uncharacterized protein LOC109481439 [Branchiostoma belcheri]|uniref:Uncharacterized protein LOC109481439 n=1 Tax=Branchiostoma belcheri TaxID=7741 RepID=A0A6P5ACQ3_BRABE|nr:PREDICTED: uncharacterized protein LOC109481439 [Branchiostoma belcheri]